MFLLLNNGFSQTRFFSLSKQKMELSDLPYNITEIIDERDDKSNIGWAQRGLYNIQVKANFEKTIEKEVLGFLEKSLNTEQGTNIKIVIRTLKVSEKTGAFNEKGFCELALVFLLNKGSKTFQVLETTKTTEIKGADVTRKHPKNIANAFKMSFDDLIKIDLSKTADLTEYNIHGLTNAQHDSVKYKFPIFEEEVKDGIYSSYEELKNNKPSVEDRFFIEKRERKNTPWKGTYEVVPKYEESRKKIKQVWAIARDGKVFISHQKEFFPLVIDKFDLYFLGYGVPDMQSLPTGALIGGLIGAGIAAGVESSNAKKQKVKYYLDQNTGGISESFLLDKAK